MIYWETQTGTIHQGHVLDILKGLPSDILKKAWNVEEKQDNWVQKGLFV